MIVDVGHIRWIIGTTLAAGVSLALYAWADRATLDGVRGGTTAGLWFGIAGTSLMLFAGSLSALRKVPAWWWIGSRKAWLKGHIWLGLLSVVLIMCHSGFRLGGPLDRALWVVFSIIILSGIFGLMVQQSLPGLLGRQVPGEVSYEQLPYYCGILRGRADELCDAMKMAISTGETADEPAALFFRAYDDTVRPFFASPAPRRTIFKDEPAIRAWFDHIREGLRVAPGPDAENTESLIESLRLRTAEAGRPPEKPKDWQGFLDKLKPRIPAAAANAKDLTARLDKLKAKVMELMAAAGSTALPADAKTVYAELQALGADIITAEVAPRLDKLKSNVARLFETVDPVGMPALAKATFTELHSVTAAVEAGEVAHAVEAQAAGAWLAGLEALCVERARLRLQERVHRWLHGWLLLHVPLSAALLVLTIVHVVMSFFYS